MPISSPRVFQVPGIPPVNIPSGAREVRVAGEICYLIGNQIVFRVGAATGRLSTGQPHRTHYRRVDSFVPLNEEIQVNSRGTAAVIVLTMAEGHEFEARGYSRNSVMTRYRFQDGTIVTV